MAPASRRNKPLIPDLLAPGLDLVFCGTAPSPISFRERAYYANPSNRFWPTLQVVGLTPERLAPQRYRELLGLGLGLTDLNKTEYGSDHELSADAMDADSLHAKLRRYRPAAIAFTSKNAASLALCIRAPSYGREVHPIEGAVAFVLASPSGRARSFWTLDPWREAAAFVAARRAARERAA